MASTKVQRIMTQPINLIFRFLQSKARIQIWLFEQKDLRIEGRIIGFDEYMNLVLDDADEINVKKQTRKTLAPPAGAGSHLGSSDETSSWPILLSSQLQHKPNPSVEQQGERPRCDPTLSSISPLESTNNYRYH
ncbi:Small nuclear ribonucleoprotein E [Carex littledalei]|uniref:Small nuclear ribonucleoprotein E n=1 Tax=Carex littledalei TaxID=544730 RepID=A0A833RIK4_9POAL|nr:Small nuclear ribonucleoprotein E [Carex littledalei]